MIFRLRLRKLLSSVSKSGVLPSNWVKIRLSWNKMSKGKRKSWMRVKLG